MKEKGRPNISQAELEKLTTSFAAFNLVAQKLRSAYSDLQERSEDLNRNLEESNLKLRQSLAEKERISCYLKSVVESLACGVIAVDDRGNISLFNAEAERILGYKADEVLGKSYAEVLGLGGEGKFSLPQILSTGDSCSNQQREMKCRTGEKIAISSSVSLLKDEEGEALGAVEIFTPLSELGEPQEENSRMKTLAALGEMTAEVVHEVKNPLGGIRGFAELLERDLEEGDVRKKSVRKIIQGVETLNRMVATLLDYARPVALSPRKTEMIGFVDEAVSFFEMDSSQDKTNLRLVKSYPQEKIYCELDAQQFRQTLLNLLHNATQAMPDGGEIKVELCREAEPSASSRGKHASKAVLKVSDTGVGMSEDTQKKIFTPFFTTKEGGTGLGLSTVKKIVEAHRGVIRLKSKPGEGTTVAMELPLVS